MKLSWKDDTSATTTAASVSTASIRGVPMLPAAIASTPEAASIAARSVVTVVLPLVPVTPTSAIPRASARSAASSTSGRTSTPRSRAAVNTAWSSGTPGLGTSSSRPASRPARVGRLGPLDDVDPGRPRGRDPLGVPRSPGPVLDHEHVVAGGVEPADDRLAGHAEAEHDDGAGHQSMTPGMRMKSA